MSKKHFPLPARVLIILCAYILGLALFVGASCLPDLFRTLEAQEVKIHSFAEAYAAGELPEHLDSSNSRLLVYNPDGELLEALDSVIAELPYDCGKTIDRYFETGRLEPLSRLVIVEQSKHGSFDERLDFVAFVAEPVVKNGTVSAVLFLEKDMLSIAFFIADSFTSFTLIYIVGLICILITLHKTRRLRELQKNYTDNITHELKSPIASIKGLVTALSDHEMSPREQSEYFGLIFAEADRQEKMVQNILELSRIQGRGMSFKKSTVPARDLLEPLCSKYESLCDDLDMSWQMDEAILALPPLHTNAECISKLFEVLVGNAIKFTEPRGSIYLSAQQNQNHITFCIRDNGPGIPKNQLPYVFDRFYRGESSYNKGGNGLGLAIASEIVKALREKIWVESSPGEGAAFYFTVSRAK